MITKPHPAYLGGHDGSCTERGKRRRGNGQQPAEQQQRQWQWREQPEPPATGAGVAWLCAGLSVSAGGAVAARRPLRVSGPAARAGSGHARGGLGQHRPPGIFARVFLLEGKGSKGRVKKRSASVARGDRPNIATTMHDLQETLTSRPRSLYTLDEEDEIFEDASEVPLGRLDDRHLDHDDDFTSRTLAEADALREANKHLDALDLLVSHRDQLGDSDEVLWRLARATFDKAERSETDGEKEILVQECIDIAGMAVERNPNNANAHKWLAIASGYMAQFKPTAEKIKLGFVFKNEIEQAIRLCPTDPSNHHLLGRWCFEVACLSWFERKAAAALFGTPPESTFEETLEHLQKAEKLRPGFWKANAMMIGKTFAKMSDTANARLWVRKALDLPVVTQEDRESHKEAQALLSTI